MLSVVLAVVDAAVGAYLIRYGALRERRGKDAVLSTGIFLVVCAGLLVLLEVLFEPGQFIGGTPPVRQV